jgi:aldehyde:ferredoxin oxidoreductase
MIDDFYSCQGWDSAGIPTEGTLMKYDLLHEEVKG